MKQPCRKKQLCGKNKRNEERVYQLFFLFMRRARQKFATFFVLFMRRARQKFAN